MRRTVLLIPATTSALMCLLAGCQGDRPGTETASRSTSDTVAAERETTVPVTTSSDEARRLYLKGRALSDQLRPHDARKLFEEAAAKDPSFALAHYDMATIAPSPKEFLEHLDEAVKLSDKASEGERLMILSLKAGSSGDSKKSLEYVEELGDKYPRDPRALTLLGFGYSNVQQFDKAVATLNKATQADPNYAPAYNLLGYAYIPQQKYAEAETAFKKYIELVPEDPNAHDSYAELLMRTGRFDESIGHYQKALSIDPHFSNAHLGIAGNLMYQGKHEAAAAEIQKLQDQARDDGDRRSAMFNRAIVFLDQGRTPQALKELERLYAFDAKLGDTAGMSTEAQQMGDILLESGRADEAAKRFRQSLALVQASSLSPEIKEVSKSADHLNLARVALAKGDLKEAKTHADAYRTAVEPTEDVGRIRSGHELLGRIALQEKDFDAAVSHLGQADQQDPYVLYTLATAYQGKGDTAKAKELAKQAATAHSLPSLRYAMVRSKATKMS
jgi:tetratricopeptide (TPR) repeat protein